MDKYHRKFASLNNRQRYNMLLLTSLSFILEICTYPTTPCIILIFKNKDNKIKTNILNIF